MPAYKKKVSVPGKILFDACPEMADGVLNTTSGDELNFININDPRQEPVWIPSHKTNPE
jgi:hypothetical protein